jgi:L-fuconolactonase
MRDGLLAAVVMSSPESSNTGAAREATLNATGKITNPIDWANYYDDAWLAQHQEEILEPALPIIDPHHHLWARTNYMVPELMADLNSGHNIRATVFLETNAEYLTTGPEHLRASGETAFVVRKVAEAKLPPGATDICAGIIGMVDLTLDPKLVDEALVAHIEAGEGRFRGIRLNAMWDAQVGWNPNDRPGRMAERETRAGFARLAPHNLVCEVMLFHPQLGELADLARAFPDTIIVANHLGGKVGIGPYKGRDKEVFADWKRGIAEIASCPNIRMKLGGMATPFFSGWTFGDDPKPPSSETLEKAYRPWVETAIEAFGADRCMFESNFPADKAFCSYQVVWNAFKRLAHGASAAEKQLLFSGVAGKTYRITI